MKIVTFLRKNDDPPKRVVDFPWERDTFRNKIMKSSRILTKKVTTTTVNPGNRRGFCVWIHFFHFSFFFHHFYPFLFRFFFIFSVFFFIFSFFFHISFFFIFSFILFHFLSFSFIFFHFPSFVSMRPHYSPLPLLILPVLICLSSALSSACFDMYTCNRP